MRIPGWQVCQRCYFRQNDNQRPVRCFQQARQLGEAFFADDENRAAGQSERLESSLERELWIERHVPFTGREGAQNARVCCLAAMRPDRDERKWTLLILQDANG